MLDEAELAEDLFEPDHGDRFADVLQQQHELFAAVTPAEIVRAYAAMQRLAETEQHAVAGGVAVAFVHSLDLFDVDHREAEALAALRLRGCRDGRGLIEKRAPRERARLRVALDERAQPSEVMQSRADGREQHFRRDGLAQHLLAAD